MVVNTKFRFLSIVLVLAVFFTMFLPTNSNCFAETNPPDTYARDIQDLKMNGLFCKFYKNNNES